MAIPETIFTKLTFNRELLHRTPVTKFHLKKNSGQKLQLADTSSQADSRCPPEFTIVLLFSLPKDRTWLTMDSPDISYSPSHSPLRLFHTNINTLQMFPWSTNQQAPLSTAASLLNRQLVRLRIRKFLFHSFSLMQARYALFAQ